MTAQDLIQTMIDLGAADRAQILITEEGHA
jgi:hypothetical protein